MAQTPSKSCALCDKPATLYCYECKEFLCSQCQREIHGRVAVCREHNVADIYKAGNRIYKPVPVCDSHKKEFLYYCSKCDCLACKECMTSSHNGHITQEIKSITDIHRHEVDEIINKLKTKVEELTKTLETIDGEHSLLIQSGYHSYIEDAEKTSEEIFQIVKHYKQIEMNTASDFRDAETHNLKGTRVFFQRLHDEVSDSLLKFENLLQEPHDNSFFFEWKNLQKEYKIMTEESEPLLPSPGQLSGFDQDTFRRAIVDGIYKQFQMGLKELETAAAVLTEEVDTLNEKLKGKQEEIDILSGLSEEIQLKEKREIELLDENNKLKTEIKERNAREVELMNKASLKTSLGITEKGDKNTLRIVLVGCTGVGKSSVGNTLLGERYFHTSGRKKSATLKCEIAERKVGNRMIKVVDTPPIIDSDGENMASELALFFDLLSPGPHAILICISPNRHTARERRAIEMLFNFFGDDHFLDFTMLVMVGKSDIIREFGVSNNYVEKYSPETIRQIYEKCNKRIVAVENKQNMTDRQKDAERVFKEIDKLDGYYSQRYFQKLSDEKRKLEVITTLEIMIKTKEQENEELKNRRQDYQLDRNSYCKQM